MGEDKIRTGDQTAAGLEYEQFEAEHSFVGGTEDAQGEIEKVHIGGNRMQFVGFRVVGGESVAGALEVTE